MLTAAVDTCDRRVLRVNTTTVIKLTTPWVIPVVPCHVSAKQGAKQGADAGAIRLVSISEGVWSGSISDGSAWLTDEISKGT